MVYVAVGSEPKINPLVASLQTNKLWFEITNSDSTVMVTVKGLPWQLAELTGTTV